MSSGRRLRAYIDIETTGLDPEADTLTVVGLALERRIKGGETVLDAGTGTMRKPVTADYVVRGEGERAVAFKIPLLGRIPLIGQLFQNRDDTTTKTELVIFLRPVVIKDASLNGDYQEFRNSLPTADFLKEDATGAPLTSINR